jgi:hypothetical protein
MTVLPTSTAQAEAFWIGVVPSASVIVPLIWPPGCRVASMPVTVAGAAVWTTSASLRLGRSS